MLNINAISFIDGQTDYTIEALQEAVYDENSEKECWLDDGTSDIDSLDAFCYSWTYWANQLSNYLGG